MAKPSQHVVSNIKGGWDVKRSGSDKASKHFATQAEAIEWGKQVAQNQSTELYIHSKDGTIREKNSYGNDKYPPKG
ncbi:MULTISPECIES: DUF2188 domain-containing protein [Aeromonas]|uniref:DUF2188 domain-containing protein n=1 Tax=Aeromonas TaxID=642 RepID=UPI002B49455E|nr:DUF2188 domain-containing protein [Aeromonas veronii]